jgi:hypothetical protein
MEVDIYQMQHVYDMSIVFVVPWEERSCCSSLGESLGAKLDNLKFESPTQFQALTARNI